MEDRIRRVVSGCDAEVDGQLGLGVCDPEGGREAFVESGLDALDGPDDRDVRDLIVFERRR